MKFRENVIRLRNLKKIPKTVVVLIWMCMSLVIKICAMTDDSEPQQKMVMSQFRDKNTKKSKQLSVTQGEVKAKNLHNVGQSGRDYDGFWALDDLPQSVQTEQVLKTVKKKVELPKEERSKDLKSPVQSTEKMPYEIVPEVGQPLAIKKERERIPLGQNLKQNNKSQAYTFDKVMQWVIEASTGMMTYSGDHLDRDKKNAASYFSPQAWQTVNSALFNDTKSPLSRLHESKGNSRAMSVDWPKSLHMDVSEHGKIWWLKVPVMVLIKENRVEKRAFYEISLGVLSMKGEREAKFIAEDVVIKPVGIRERKIKKRVRNAR